MAVAPAKCVWETTQVKFLGYIIRPTGLEMDPIKVEAVLSWRPPNTIKDLRSFLGFANFYRRFIQDFSKVARPLTNSLALGQGWIWTQEMQEAFQALKDKFTSAPLLAHFNPELMCVVETDSSDFAIGGVLSQRNPQDELLHPIAYFSEKMSQAEINYDIHDKELLAIVKVFKAWRHYLEGSQHRIEVYTDHHNLTYFTSTKVLNRRQARWAEQLSLYNFIIFYRPGTKNGKADALSRKGELRPQKGGSEDQPTKALLRPDQIATITEAQPAAPPQFLLSAARLASLRVPNFKQSFLDHIRRAISQDPIYQNQLENPDNEFQIQNGLLYREGLLYIPHDQQLRAQILRSEHDEPTAGHWGIDKTEELVKRNYWWPDMKQFIADYVRGCLECQRNKAPRHAPYGLLQPTELTYIPWHTIAMDFITDLPSSNGCDSIWVIVDTFSKMAHFISLKRDAKGTSDLVRIFAREYWRLHGTPTNIISDRDSRFTAKTWTAFLKYMNIRPRMSTAFHPQTDGQTERTNQTLETYLRAYTCYEMNDWEDLLPTAEFAYNNSKHSATKQTPFYVNYGFHPVVGTPSQAAPRKTPNEILEHWSKPVHEAAKTALKNAQETMIRHANRRRRSPPNLRVGHLVMLNARNIKTKRPSKKLDHKLLGPFQVSKIISPTAVQLHLPSHWRIHPTFHISLIEPYRAGNHELPDPRKILREVGDVEGEDKEMVAVRDAKEFRGRVKYLVQWEGQPHRKHWTWEPYEHFIDSVDDLVAYARNNPGKPKDPRVP